VPTLRTELSMPVARATFRIALSASGRGSCTSEPVQRRRRRTTADKEVCVTSVSDRHMRQSDVRPTSRAALSCTFGRDGGTCTEEPEK
jgi:hypothetical protein